MNSNKYNFKINNSQGNNGGDDGANQIPLKREHQIKITDLQRCKSDICKKQNHSGYAKKQNDSYAYWMIKSEKFNKKF